LPWGLSDGSIPDDATRCRIDELTIPPAWRDVWIGEDPDSHLQATGIDDEDRKQYRYHERWREIRYDAKFAGLIEFADALAEIRKRVATDLAANALTRARSVAAVVRLLGTSLIRVETNGTPPRTTPSAPPHWRLVTSAHVDDYLADTVGSSATAKTFPTWGATAIAVRTLATVTSDASHEQGFLAAVDAAAQALGNTRAVCRSCYVAPAIASAAVSGSLADAWASSRAGRWRDRSENATAKLL